MLATLRLAAVVPALAMVLALAPGAEAGAREPDRRIVSYVVRPGDTATELAVRFHAWTAELLALNGLTERSTLYVGQRLRIPVVPRARRSAPPPHRPEPKADPHRDRVARVIVATARKRGVDARLALAVSWQEAGWQMHHVSSAGAIGAMQVLPSTGAWMSLYVGRHLNLTRLRGNVAAGVMLLRVLRDNTDTRRQKIGAYYQGLGAVRRNGLYPETRRYVANVLALRRMLIRGQELG